jgi:hypothetical protein
VCRELYQIFTKKSDAKDEEIEKFRKEIKEKQNW